MGIGPRDKESVHLFPNQISMSQKLDMNMFEITFWKFSFQDESDGLRVLIILKRKFISEIMTTYFPSFLLLATTVATTFFKPFFFEAALSVNLTTMLVMTTIFMSNMEILPSTSDIKMIDIWLVLCQMVPFAEVVLLTAMEYNRKDDDLEQREVTPLQIDTVENDEDDSGEKCYQRCWIPDLKTVGRCTSLLFSADSFSYFLLLSFKKRKCSHPWCWQAT